MIFIDLNARNDRAANPKPEALRGYSLDKEIRAAAKAAVKSLAKKLAHYRSEVARLQANCDKWSADAYAAKLDAIAARAQAGDAEAVNAIESGAVPSRQTFGEMHGRFCGELDQFQRDNRGLFAEALALVKEPMAAAVAKGQTILDDLLEGLGVPRFEITGWTNHCDYVWKQLGHASRFESADLDWFWSAVE